MAVPRPRLGPELSRAAELMQRGDTKEAAAICRRVLKKNKRDVDAHQLLGLIASMIGRFDDAVASFQRGLKIDPKSPMLLCGLGKAWTTQGRYDDAVAVYDRALAAAPGYPPALFGKADTLERLGRFDEARDLLAPIVAAGAEDGETALIYATLLQREKQDDDAVALLSRHLARPTLAEITRRKLLFAIGKSFDRLGEHDRAFASFRRGNQLFQAPFSIDAVREEFARVRATFSPERLPALARSTNESDVPIFVVSMPRSGSTLVEQILAAHPDVHGAGEIEDMLRVVRDLPRSIVGGDTYPEIVERLSRPIADKLASRYLSAVRTLAPDARRVVDKNLQNWRHLGLISLLFPRARVVWVRRHPLAICFSCYMLPLSPVGLPFTTDLERLGLYFREYEAQMRYWQRTLDLPILEIEYEAIVDDPERWSRTLIDFAGLEWNDACLRFHASGRRVSTASYDQVRRPIYREAIERYVQYEEHLGPLREALGMGGATERRSDRATEGGDTGS